MILTPVYNDAESLNILLDKLSVSLIGFPETKFTVLAIDDGSTDKLEIKPSSFFTVQLLHLQRNLGHQKAIAIGLAYLRDHFVFDKVLVMDSDGEDRPDDATRLLQNSADQPSKIIFAQRKRRQEGQGFRFFYNIYKLLFGILTGRKIGFGNFLVMPLSLLDKAVHYSEIWNHVAGGLIKTGLPYVSVPADRGKRYAGQSKMNFQSLLLHGLGAIAVFIEVIASRLLIFSLILIGISFLTIITLIGIKTFTHKAIPGWTSTVVSAMLIILLQSFLLSLFTIFLYLSSQAQRKFIPAYHYKDYTGTAETIG